MSWSEHYCFRFHFDSGLLLENRPHQVLPDDTIANNCRDMGFGPFERFREPALIPLRGTENTEALVFTKPFKRL